MEYFIFCIKWFLILQCYKLIQFKMKLKILNLIFLWDIICVCIFVLILQYYFKYRKFYYKKVFEIMINFIIMYIRFIKKKKIIDYNVMFIISDLFGFKIVVCSFFLFLKLLCVFLNFFQDLKFNNLLINDNGILKIGDFGLVKFFGLLNRVYIYQVVIR